jgi:hypothetical protein
MLEAHSTLDFGYFQPKQRLYTAQDFNRAILKVSQRLSRVMHSPFSSAAERIYDIPDPWLKGAISKNP